MTQRRRRTADESRSIILDVAARRLREFGLEGLNITGVSEEAGISHATLIHHFGSSGGMRDALADMMTTQLIRDLLTALDAKVPPQQLMENVFDALADGGHAKLLAWRAVEGARRSPQDNSLNQLFEQLVETSRAVIDVESEEQLRQTIYLVATSAIGHGLAGGVLARMLGMTTEEHDGFAEWVNVKLSK